MPEPQVIVFKIRKPPEEEEHKSPYVQLAEGIRRYGFGEVFKTFAQENVVLAVMPSVNVLDGFFNRIRWTYNPEAGKFNIVRRTKK